MVTPGNANVRPARISDLESIGYISHHTGLLGEPIEEHFPDRNLWTDAFVRPFLEVGCCNFVAEVEGRVVGYIIGSCDPSSFERYVHTRLPLFLLKRWLRGSYPNWRRELGYLWRAWRFAESAASWKRYPAQLHINLLPEARGLGLGSSLMQTFLDCLHEKGIGGVQLSTTEKNDAALRLYQKFGFHVALSRRSPFWLPIVGEKLRHLRLVKELRPPRQRPGEG